MCDMLKGHMGHIRAKPVQTPQAPSHLPRRKVLSLWGLLQRLKYSHTSSDDSSEGEDAADVMEREAAKIAKKART
ncbi:hypothetical protein WJX77_009729 [Trebouxia sp. C0004]